MARKVRQMRRKGNHIGLVPVPSMAAPDLDTRIALIQVRLSRRRFESIFGVQYSALLDGSRPHFGQACQKQPSTNTMQEM